MTKTQWKKFYGRLRLYSWMSNINMFGSDFGRSLRYAVPNESRRYAMWASGFTTRLWHFALTLFLMPRSQKLSDSYKPLTKEWKVGRVTLAYAMARLNYVKVRINFADLTSTTLYVHDGHQDLDAAITRWVKEVYSPTAVITGYHIITHEQEYTQEELQP